MSLRARSSKSDRRSWQILDIAAGHAIIATAEMTMLVLPGDFEVFLAAVEASRRYVYKAEVRIIAIQLALKIV